jgi:hypothetical protein
MKFAAIMIASVILFSCSKDPNIVVLERAAQAVEQMVAPLQAQRSSFFVVLPNGTPKEFVSWFFSPLGTSEWPVIDESTDFTDDERASMRLLGTPFRPKDVEYRHSYPDTAAQKQIVLKWDNEEGKVILEGYLDSSQPPVLTKSFKLPKNVVPDPIAKIAVQSNLELGMSFQSF